MTLRHLKFLLNFLNSTIQVIHEVLLFRISRSPLAFLLGSLFSFSEITLELNKLLFVLLDDFLAEMAALG